VEHGCRLVNQLFVVTPLFLKTPPRIAALGFLMLVGALGAGLIERQGRRALAELQPPISGLRPAGRAPLPPPVARLFKVFAASSRVQVTEARGRVGEPRVARLQPVQVPILKLSGLPQPAELFAQPVLA
jgi:hypothetical protein